MKCPACGDENNLESSLYCWKCKSPLGEEKLACPACGNVTPTTWVKCQHCGADLAERAAAARKAAKEILSDYQDNLAARDSTIVRVESRGRRLFDLLLAGASGPAAVAALLISGILWGGKRRVPPALIFFCACAVFAAALVIRGDALLPDALDEYAVHLAGISAAASLLIMLRQAQLGEHGPGMLLQFTGRFVFAFSLGTFLTLTALIVLAGQERGLAESGEPRIYSVEEILRLKRPGVRPAALPEKLVHWDFSDEKPVYRLEKGDGSFATFDEAELRKVEGLKNDDYSLLLPVHGSDYRIWVSSFTEEAPVSGFLETIAEGGGQHISKIVSALRGETYSGNIHILVCANAERYHELRSGSQRQSRQNSIDWTVVLAIGAILLVVSGWMLFFEA